MRNLSTQKMWFIFLDILTASNEYRFGFEQRINMACQRVRFRTNFATLSSLCTRVWTQKVLHWQDGLLPMREMSLRVWLYGSWSFCSSWMEKRTKNLALRTIESIKCLIMATKRYMLGKQLCSAIFLDTLYDWRYLIKNKRVINTYKKGSKLYRDPANFVSDGQHG